MNEQLLTKIEELSKNMEILSLGDESLKIIKEGSKYLTTQYKSQSYNFITKYIIDNMNYPTKESKLVQALMELESRFNNLTTRLFDIEEDFVMINILEDEISLLDKMNDNRIYVPTLRKDKSFNANELSQTQREYEIKLRQIKIRKLKYKIESNKHTAEEVYKEFINWKKVIEEKMNELNIKDLNEFNFDNVKDEELKKKIEVWEKLNKEGLKNNLTPSEMSVVLANK